MDKEKALMWFGVTLLLLMHSIDVHCITVRASIRPTGTLTINESKLTIACSFTKHDSDDVLAVELKRKYATEASFRTIVTFPGSISSHNITYVDTSLVSRTTATRPGSSTHDQATLAYNVVKCEDKADYQCSLTYLSYSVLSNVLKIDSLKSKSQFNTSQLTFAPASNLKEGDHVTFTCKGDAGDEPPAGFSWYMLYGVAGETPTNLTPGAVTTLVPVPGECRFNRTSKLDLTLTPQMNNMVVRCTAQQDLPFNEFGDNYSSYRQLSRMHIYYSPKGLRIVSDPVIAPGGSYSEGLSRLTLTCSSDANPPATYYWTAPGMNKVIEGSTLVLENLTLVDTNTYTCVAYNEFIGANHTAKATMMISVQATDVSPSTSVPTAPSTTARYPINGPPCYDKPTADCKLLDTFSHICNSKTTATDCMRYCGFCHPMTSGTDIIG